MIGELTRIRRENRAFDARADVWTFDTDSDHVLGIGRYFEGQKLLALLNFSDRALDCQRAARQALAEDVHGFPSWRIRKGRPFHSLVAIPGSYRLWLRPEPF